MPAEHQGDDRIGLHELPVVDTDEGVLTVSDTRADKILSRVTLAPMNPVGRAGNLSDADGNKHTIAIGHRVQSSEDILGQLPIPSVRRIGDEAHKVNTTSHGHEHTVAEGHTCQL